MAKRSFATLFALIVAMGLGLSATAPTIAAAGANARTTTPIFSAPIDLSMASQSNLVLANDQETSDESALQSDSGDAAASPSSCVKYEIRWLGSDGSFGTFLLYLPAGDFGFYAPDLATLSGPRDGGTRNFDLRARWFSDHIDFEYSVAPACSNAPFNDTYAYSLVTSPFGTQRSYHLWHSWDLFEGLICVPTQRLRSNFGEAKLVGASTALPSQCLEAK